MRAFISLLFVLSFVCNVFSQSAEGRYHSRRTQDGVLFFVNPHILKDLCGLKRFEYDMTLLTWTDTVTINFTLESDSMDTPEDVTINAGKHMFHCEKSSVLYIDLKKEHYEIRVSSEFRLRDIITIIQSEAIPFFTFVQDGKERCAKYAVKDWMKEKKRLNDILDIYLYSKSL